MANDSFNFGPQGPPKILRILLVYLIETLWMSKNVSLPQIQQKYFLARLGFEFWTPDLCRHCCPITIPSDTPVFDRNIRTPKNANYESFLLSFFFPPKNRKTTILHHFRKKKQISNHPFCRCYSSLSVKCYSRTVRSVSTTLCTKRECVHMT